MFGPTQIAIPTLVRAKPGALERLGVYLARERRHRVVVLISQGLQDPLVKMAESSLRGADIEIGGWSEVDQIEQEAAIRHFEALPSGVAAVVGVGGGKALDMAKYVAFLARLPYYAAPTSLSNDGFCSPQSSLTIRGRRRSLPAALPRGVVIDTAVCGAAPRWLTLSGVGDLAAKWTAIRDWKLAFHARGEAVDDFAALIAEGAVQAFRGHAKLDLEGVRLLATGLLLSGIAMQIAGSSRPASGAEHLISHALDQISPRPRAHGLQVGVAAYLVSLLQEENTSAMGELFEATGFWEAIAGDPFLRSEWREAIALAPHLKEGFYTVLSDSQKGAEALRLLEEDPVLARCFA